MPLKVIETALPGVLIIDPAVYPDERGFFMETFHGRKYAEHGIERAFVQDNHSHSRRFTLRGLHYQLHRPQAKLVYVVSGEIFDAAVDIRRGSPTFCRWIGTKLSAKNKRQIYVPEGFAHGFCVLSDEADVIYKCTDYYAPDDEYGLLWSDPQIGIEWPIDNPVLSTKDSQNPVIQQAPPETLPVFNPVKQPG